MNKKPAYEELELRVRELEAENARRKEIWNKLHNRYVDRNMISQGAAFDLDKGTDERVLVNELQTFQVELELQNEELRSTQNELLKSRNRLNVLFQKAPHGILILDKSGKILDINHTALSAMGLNYAAVRNTHFSAYMTTEDASIFNARFNAFFKQPEGKKLECKLGGVNGVPTAFFSVCGRLLDCDPDDDSEAEQQLLVSLTDITDQHHLALRERHVAQLLLASRNINKLVITTHNVAQLIETACRIMTEDLGYFNAWIALFSLQTQQVVSLAESGIGNRFEPVRDMIMKGHFPEALRRALAQPSMVLITNPAKECQDCPLSAYYDDRVGMVQRLEFNGVIYGAMAVSVDRKYLQNAGEQKLFSDLVGDLSLGIHKIETEQKVARLESIFETVPFPMSMTSPDYRYLVVNDVYSNFYGCPKEQIEGRLLTDFMGEDVFVNEVKPHIDHCLQGEKVEYEVEVDFPGNGLRQMRMTYYPFFDQDGSVIGVVSHGVDRTELHRSERRLKTILQATPVGICITDANGIFLQVNPAYCRMYGYQPEELLGQEFTMVVPEENRAFMRQLHADFINGAKELRGEWTVVNRTGKEFVILADASLIADDDGKPCKVTFIMDISERKELENLKEDVDRILRHDLKQPLNAIVGFPQLLEQSENLDEQERMFVRHISNAGFKMLQMVNNSLDMFKMEKGTYEYTPQVVNAVAVVFQVVSHSRLRIDEKKLAVELLINDRATSEDAMETVLVRADEQLLYSLLSNLLTNAVEATDKATTITVHITHNENAAIPTVIQMSNTGVVPEEIRANFFDKYVTMGKHKGTGLGTYSARLLCRTMDYDISMKTSAEENKTTLSIFIPL